MYISPQESTSFSEKQKAVFLKYCMLIRKYGKYAPNVDKQLIYREVADALFYTNHESVAHIICKMLKAGYQVKPDLDTEECSGKLTNLETIKNERP